MMGGDSIEPSTFDAIVLGTGLPESILAASIAASGKSVLHLDAYDGYLSPWATLNFSQFLSFASTGGCIPKPEFSLEDEEDEKKGDSLGVPIPRHVPSRTNSGSELEGAGEAESFENLSAPGPFSILTSNSFDFSDLNHNAEHQSLESGIGSQERLSDKLASIEGSTLGPELPSQGSTTASSLSTPVMQVEVSQQELGFEAQEHCSGSRNASGGDGLLHTKTISFEDDSNLNSEFISEQGEILTVEAPDDHPRVSAHEDGVMPSDPASIPHANIPPHGSEFEAETVSKFVAKGAGECVGAEQTDDALLESPYKALKMKDTAGLYSNVKVRALDESALGRVNQYHLDLAGPKVAFCAGPLVDALLRARADHHVRFKAVEASYIWRENCLAVVPASRADIFRDRSLSLPDKRFLMRFFKLVTDQTESDDRTTTELAAGDLDRPFVELLQTQHLPLAIQEIILYAIALVDEDQHQIGHSTNFLTVKDGFQALSLYLASSDRFPDAPGAFLYPMYGQGDLPQAFCRCAAVRGALYVLRMPVTSLLVDQEKGEYKGIKIASGQVLYSGMLIASPLFCLEPLAQSSDPPVSWSETETGVDTSRCSSSNELSAGPEKSKGSTMVARCICVIDQSLQVGVSTILVIFPPKSLNRGKSNVVRALQLGETSDVCPNGKYIVQLSTVCLDATTGEESLQAARHALFHCDDSIMQGMTESSKPKLIWCAFYVQEVPETSQVIRGLRVSSMPDGTLDYCSMMTTTERIFHELFPEQEFLPRPATSVSDTEDGFADDSESEDD